MMIDCPHCYTRIVPKPDGCCPACQGDTRDVPAKDLTQTPLRVSQGDILPPVCCECGCDTSNRVCVYRKTSGERDEPSTVTGTFIFLCISWIVGLYMLLRGMASARVVRVTMPMCETCAKHGPPQPRHVDFENARMTFIVHKNLVGALRR